MNIFSISQAKHYCSNFSRSTGDAEKSIEEFQENYLKITGSGKKNIKEGNLIFQQYRDCSLRDVERSLFLAASNYRRSLDLMIPSASYWSQVTLYYGSWYASRALLGMFGCTAFGNKIFMDVEKGNPGQQELRIQKLSSTYSGPHRFFWFIFYEAFSSLTRIVDPRLAAVIKPISGDPMWQTDNRIKVNYKTLSSLQFAEEFKRTFRKEKFPLSLPGVLYTQFHIVQTLLEYSFYFARDFGLNTDALNCLGSSTSLSENIYKHIYHDSPPGLVQKSKKRIFK